MPPLIQRKVRRGGSECNSKHHSTGLLSHACAHTTHTHTHSGKGVEGVEGRAHSKRDSDRTQCGGVGGEESRQARTGLREREREGGREGGERERERELENFIFQGL